VERSLAHEEPNTNRHEPENHNKHGARTASDRYEASVIRYRMLGGGGERGCLSAAGIGASMYRVFMYGAHPGAPGGSPEARFQSDALLGMSKFPYNERPEFVPESKPDS
jgi:hypothetical protein